jgi:polar amino acid transport system substrate-binding protein
MRRLARAAVVLSVGAALTACGNISTTGTSTTLRSSGGDTTAAPACSYNSIQSELYTKGQLTIATDNPVYTPWFVNNKPSNGLGYESATAYAIAAALGFTKSQVHWVYEPFNSSYAPGPKKFDFDINEISITPQRAQEVSFSIGYYNDTQALVVLKNGPIYKDHSPAALKHYVYGDQIGTTSLAFINDEIKPTTTIKPYNNLNDVGSALDTNQIQAFVTDTPTAQYMATTIKGAVVVGQFPPSGEQFGLLFAKGNPLVTCVDKAIHTITANGQLASFNKKYLQIYNVIPTIKP